MNRENWQERWQAARSQAVAALLRPEDAAGGAMATPPPVPAPETMDDVGPAACPVAVVPGALFVLPTSSPAAVEWLVVRAHPDDPETVLLVPVDECPLAGPADLRWARYETSRPRTARCGQALWVSAPSLAWERQAGKLEPPLVAAVQEQLSGLARGESVVDDGQRSTAWDPDYEDWCGYVEQAREDAVRRLDRPLLCHDWSSLAAQPPAGLVAPPPLALAAESSDALESLLEQATQSALDNIRYLAVGGFPGRLVLQVGLDGVCALWQGAAPPSLWGTTGDGKHTAAHWQPLADGTSLQSLPLFPWIAGQLTLRIGDGASQCLLRLQQ